MPISPTFNTLFKLGIGITNGVSQQQSTLQNLINPMSLSQFTSFVDGTPAGQGVMQGYGTQGAAPQGFGYGNANPVMQGYGTQGAAPQGFGYGNASPVLQGYGMSQQQQFNPYAAQGGYPPYATAGGQIIYG